MHFFIVLYGDNVHSGVIDHKLASRNMRDRC